ncbi:FAD/NAD(P)-binding protein [Flavobacterium sp. 9AF]|uniref:FAD/NAD(P)-binding protein n=1 Tax=Flavobacterium sp. 9AF TaxID=2653142 RepID=UPI0013579B00|nr:FAD/NAD(P)-binding protein [Flavobacterium sp. 9AF]
MKNLAIIGSGATSIYLLKHILDNIEVLKKEILTISIFEKSYILGMGMPYNPETTDLYNLSNISSEELPKLQITFEEWLLQQNQKSLNKLGIKKEMISKSEVYNRLALGQYLQNQYQTILSNIKFENITVNELPHTEVIDILYDNENKKATLITNHNEELVFNKVIVATGHIWNEKDNILQGYYASPWPIKKILPKENTFHNYTIGTLGASLSAFDVVSSLSRRHGNFIEDKNGNLKYISNKGAENFKIVMHSVNGWLPHLQYEQEKPIRQIYRHFSKEDIYDCFDRNGFLRIENYFNKCCLKPLIEAFKKDNLFEMANKLQDSKYTIKDFVNDMSKRHEYENAFEGMRLEMKDSKKSIENKKPIHWKEVIDDLMYTLNFHAELLPAEDHLLFHQNIMPFLMNVIAAMPIPSARILLALHDANKIEIIKGYVTLLDETTNNKTKIKVTHNEKEHILEYQMFINCSGQPPVTVDNYPFPSLIKNSYVVSPKIPFSNYNAYVKNNDAHEEKNITYRHQNHYYIFPGINVDSSYTILDKNNQPITNIHDISFTHLTGLRPYSYGLQACSATSEILVSSWIKAIKNEEPIQGNIEEIVEIYAENPHL